MKLPIGASPFLRRTFQISLLLGIAGTWLSGCYGNHAGLFPNDWNIPDLPEAQVHSAISAALNKTAAALSFPPALVGGLQRQADCSLTYFDFSYASDSASVTVTPNAQIPHYEKTLHDNAFLRTTPDQFLAGCMYANQGITSGYSFSWGQEKTDGSLSPCRGYPASLPAG